MRVTIKCSRCGVDRSLTKESAYEATRLGKMLCVKCARTVRKPKISKYASVIKSGDVFGNWTIVGDFLGNGSWIKCQCACGNSRMVRAYKLLDGTHPKQCRQCSTGQKSSNWRGVGKLPKSVYTTIKLRAKNRNKKFIVSMQYLAELFDAQNERCALSGLPIHFGEDGKNLSETLGTASLDRIDSSQGYVPGNVHWVHKHINIMKNEYSAEYFLNLCREVVLHNDSNRNT